jgi:hypothetical protein
MFGGLISDGSNSYFTVSRLPYRKSGAGATALCQKGDTDCDAEIDVLVLATGLTLADWVGLPITQIGWIGATYATAGGAWTLLTDNTPTTGFNTEYSARYFAMPLAQNGASAGTYFLPNTGTAPVFTTNSYYYSITPFGVVKAFVGVTGDGGTDGATAVAARVASPFNILIRDFGVGSVVSATPLDTVVQVLGTESTTYFSLNYQSTIGTANSEIRHTEFPNGGRSCYFSIQFMTLP